jgi:hypothetical protein
MSGPGPGRPHRRGGGPATGTAADPLRGVRCNVCKALGEHYDSQCPLRVRVGIPSAFQPPVVDPSAPAPATPPETGTAAPRVTTVPEFPPTAVLGPLFLSGPQLYTAVATRSDVPGWCTCVACGLIADAAVWCSACDSVACATCMAPAGPHSTLCPVCGTTATDDVHAVGPLRAIIDTMFMAVAEQVDTLP